MNSFEKLLDAGVSEYGIVDTKEIIFGDEIRKICENNMCGNYGKTWACPPNVGSVEECKAGCLSYNKALVFCSRYELEDSFDIEGMREGHNAFKTVTDNVYELVKNEINDFVLLSNESCNRCKVCTCPESPCRFPDKLFASIEGYGIYVGKLSESAGIKYIKPGFVSYFGMLLYDKKEA